MKPLLLECMLHNSFLIIVTFWKRKPLRLIRFSPIFGKDSDVEVATVQLIAVVDVIFAPHDNPEISGQSRDPIIKDIACIK